MRGRRLEVGSREQFTLAGLPARVNPHQVRGPGLEHAPVLVALGRRPAAAFRVGLSQRLIPCGESGLDLAIVLLAPDGAGELQRIERSLRDATARRSTDLLSS